MKTLLITLFIIPSVFTFSQSWNFVGTESFTPEGCSSMKISKNDYGEVVCVTDPWDGSTRYLHPYSFNGTEWDTLFGVINHSVFTTNDLQPDIEMHTTNGFYIYTFGGPNKSYLYEANYGTFSWSLVDSVDADHVDLETGAGGGAWMSGYQNIFDHDGLGSHTTYTFPTLMSFNQIAVNGSDEPFSFHATNSNAYEVNQLTGGSYTEVDSINYGTGTSGYDIEISTDQPVTVHLDPTTNEIILKKFNGSTWDQTVVNSGITYNVGEVAFNLGIDALSGNIVIGVNHFTTTTGPPMTTTNTIDVFMVSADLTTETDLGTATSFTYDGAGSTGIFDVEVRDEVAYVGYINYEDANKGSVKSYDLSLASVDNKTESMNFQMYPNPANEQLFIQTDLVEYDLEIIDVSGKILMSKHIAGGANLDISDYATGIYFVRISDHEKYSATKKLIVKK